MKIPDSNVISSVRTVFASCRNPQKQCMLYDVMQWRKNTRVTQSFTSDQAFVCSIALRGAAADISDDMPALIAFCKQVCAACNQSNKNQIHR